MIAVHSPGRYISHPGAMSLVGTEVAAHGVSALIVHGSVGIELVREEMQTSLAAAGVHSSEARHTGYCGVDSVARLVAAARQAGSNLVVGVGGGRVLDTSKAAADALGQPCVLIPTSPATCSAASAVVVDYSTDGRYTGSRVVTRPAVAALVDPEVLSRAPDRHLVAGMVDALAKVVEVRFATSRLVAPGAGIAAARALCDELESLLLTSTEEGAAVVHQVDLVDGGPSRRKRASSVGQRQLVAEACVLWPGIIGSLAGERARLAAAHAVHNALTLLPGSHSVLHGELISFGVLVQLALEQREDDVLESTAAWFAKLGCPHDLDALGCGDYLTDAEARDRVLARTCALPSMRATFPEIDGERLAEAVRRANDVALNR